MSLSTALGSSPSASLTKFGIGSATIPVGSDTTSSTATQLHPPLPSAAEAPSTLPNTGGIAPLEPGEDDHCCTFPFGSMITLPAATGVFGVHAGLAIFHRHWRLFCHPERSRGIARRLRRA